MRSDVDNEELSYSERTTEQINNAIEVFQHNIQVLREYHTRLIAAVVAGKVDVRQSAATLPEFGQEEEIEPDEVEEVFEEAENAN